MAEGDKGWHRRRILLAWDKCRPSELAAWRNCMGASVAVCFGLLKLMILLSETDAARMHFDFFCFFLLFRNNVYRVKSLFI